MKTKYRHIHFNKLASLYDYEDKPCYNCKNSKQKSMLGQVFYYDQWNRYLFEGNAGCVFDTSCLADIIDFMKQLK